MTGISVAPGEEKFKNEEVVNIENGPKMIRTDVTGDVGESSSRGAAENPDVRGLETWPQSTGEWNLPATA